MINARDERFRVSREVAKDLVQLRDARVIADYHIDKHVDYQLASESARLALNVLKTTT